MRKLKGLEKLFGIMFFSLDTLRYSHTKLFCKYLYAQDVLYATGTDLPIAGLGRAGDLRR